MLELLLLPALVGVAFAIDYLPSVSELLGGDDADDGPEIHEITLASDVSVFEGTDAIERVQGNALDNLLSGGAANDVLNGHDGDDLLIGAAGNDQLGGGDGNDTADGGAGDDRIFLAAGEDTSAPILQDPESNGDAGDDLIRGGAGHDQIVDTRGSNQLFGDTGRDILVAVDGLAAGGSISAPEEQGTADTLHGGYGDDTLVGDAGDQMTGGVGDDLFVLTTASNTPGMPAILTDFNLEDDLLSVVFLDEAPEDTVVEFLHDPETSEVHAVVDGRNVATLKGLNAEDIPFIQTYVATLPDVLTQAA